MYVYFIQGQSTRLIKIGITRGNVYKRLAQIQGHSPDKLKLLKAVKGNSKYEKDLHKQFASVHSHGEWFYPSRGLMVFIEGLKGAKIRKPRKKVRVKHCRKVPDKAKARAERLKERYRQEDLEYQKRWNGRKQKSAEKRKAWEREYYSKKRARNM